MSLHVYKLVKIRQPIMRIATYSVWFGKWQFKVSSAPLTVRKLIFIIPINNIYLQEAVWGYQCLIYLRSDVLQVYQYVVFQLNTFCEGNHYTTI